MSMWSYITGVIEVSPAGRSQHEKRYILDSVLAHLPKVTGSERDMEVYVSQRYGHSLSCPHDEYGTPVKNELCRIQENYLLTVRARLRDREFNETYRSFLKWLCRLAKRCFVEDVFVMVSSYEKKAIITDKNGAFWNMNECPSWVNGTGEIAWFEHLMWEPAEDDDMPMLLKKKYDKLKK